MTPGMNAGVIREHKDAEVQVIGPEAVYIVVKASILASRYLKENVMVGDKVHTAMKLMID